MFKIGEFSRLTQVSKRMLRYYDETNLITPCRKEPLTGYRLYDLNQIPQINKIKTLRDLGFLIDEISLLMSLEDEALTDYLDQQELKIEEAIITNQQKLEQLEALKKAIQNQTSEMIYEVQIKAVPAYQIVSLRTTIDNYFAEGPL